MDVDIDDRRDRSRSIHANWWQWRPTIELIRSLELFDKQRLDYLSDGFGEFTEVEAREMANALERLVLSELHTGERVRIDRTVTNEPGDGSFHHAPEEQHRNYSADYEWLIWFVAFCKQSGGIHVC